MGRFLLAAFLLTAAACACRSRTAERAADDGPASAAQSRCVSATPEAPPPQPEPVTDCPLDPVFGGISMKKEALEFSDVSPPKTITVELAVTEEERGRGLMYRTHLPKETGMLFVSDGPEKVQTFWMRNTCIPLDMLFIAKDGFIAGILENVPPMNDKRRSIPCPVRYVLEVPGGWSRKNGIAAGQHVKLPSVK